MYARKDVEQIPRASFTRKCRSFGLYSRQQQTHQISIASMSTPDANIAEHGRQERLEQLKQAAEAQMRRPAPAIGSTRAAKRQRTEDGDAAGESAAARVSRYNYAAPEALLSGSTCFLITCGLSRCVEAFFDLVPGQVLLVIFLAIFSHISIWTCEMQADECNKGGCGADKEEAAAWGSLQPRQGRLSGAGACLGAATAAAAATGGGEAAAARGGQAVRGQQTFEHGGHSRIHPG